MQISTKNPEVFLSYAEDFVGANIAFNVSMSFYDDDISRKIEVGAISPSRRLEAIKELSKMGFKVTARLQPFILPYSFDVAERFVSRLKECGVWGFQTEGLKLRISMSQKEKEIYKKIGDILGFDIFDYYKRYGTIEGGDRVYSDKDKIKMIELYDSLAKKYGIKFFNADNLVDNPYGCGCECCGTEFLRNHTIWGGCIRTKKFPNGDYKTTSEFGKCLVNFGRGNDHGERTISQICEEYNKEYAREERNKKYVQLSLFD